MVFRSIRNILSRYWRVYGGWVGVGTSPYLWLSVVLTSGLTWFLIPKGDWYELTLAVFPDLVGFSLAGLAMLLGFGDERFRKLISGSTDGKPSPFLRTTANIVHFILIQVVALLLASIGKAMGEGSTPVEPYITAVGTWAYVYGLLLAAATVLQMFRLAQDYELHRTEELMKELNEERNTTERSGVNAK